MDDYLTDRKVQFEDDLIEFLSIPSISTDGEYRGEVRKAGNWVADQFRSINFHTEVIDTPGHPIIYAESPPVDGAPTVLVYGHYDVQPPDPLDQWESPPFEPTRRDGYIYARGATDDKGQMLTHIKSAQALTEKLGSLPIQVKYLIEGEEEVGSDNLYPFLQSNREKLECDVAVISDTSQFAHGQPAITYGLKGICYYEVHLTGPKQDLHSGMFGGAITNPVNTLARLLSMLIDDQGRVQLPEFYNDVVPLSQRERQQFADLPFDEAEFMRQVGVDGVTGETGFTTLERRWARPTFDINGIWGGYQGEGQKTILPAKAGAKFSFRLVPDQDPEAITESLRRFFADNCPPGIELEMLKCHGAPGVVVSLDSPYMKAAQAAIEKGFGRAPVFIREGGSIPVVSAFREVLEIDTLLLGWGQDDDNLHSPNERFSLQDFHRGIKSSVNLWQELAKLNESSDSDAQN